MKAKTFGAQYELVEFNHYVDSGKEKPINVVDFVVESDNIEFIENEFSHLFVIETGETLHVFNDYELTECYEVGGGLIRVICVK
jgi:hypothetical protein